MNCDEFRAALLAGEETAATGQHEQSCASCRALAADLRAAHTSLSDPGLWEEPSPELARQVEDLIGNASRGTVTVGAKPARTWLSVAAIAVVIAAVGAFAFAVSRPAEPDWDVALPATDLAPGAVATVAGWNEEAGTRMVVTVSGLAPAPDGYIYEFWLSNGPLHISAGTFHSGGEIELWSGVSRRDFPRLWVTLEAIDEDESPSRQTVLDTGRA
jgi:hypothetical protein